MNNWFSLFALAQLGFKTVQILKQASSFVTSYSDYNYKNLKPLNPLNLVAYAIDTAFNYANIIGNIKKAMEISPTFRDRMKGWSVYSLESGRAEIRRTGVRRLLQIGGGAFTKIGDILGVMGYMTVYNRNIKNGMNPIKAAELFDDYNETQQTRRTQDLSALQLSNNIIYRGILMFASTGILQLNAFFQTYSNIFRKTKGRFWKADQKDLVKLLLNTSIANALFFTAGNFLKMKGEEEDKEEFWRGFFKALSGMNMIQSALPLTGNTFSYMYDIATGVENPFTAQGENLNPLLQASNTVIRANKKKDYAKIATAIIEFMAGVNTKPFMAMFKSVNPDASMTEDELRGQLFRIFGFGSTSMPASYSGYKWAEITKGPRKGEVRKRKLTDRERLIKAYQEGGEEKRNRLLRDLYPDNPMYQEKD